MLTQSHVRNLAKRARLSLVAFTGLLSLSSLVSLSLLSTGCTHVAPYERGALAHATMAASGLDGLAARHVTAVHEGATGGGSVAESGCGCN
jgi:hypothetical protein